MLLSHLEDLVGWWSNTGIEYDLIEPFKRCVTDDNDIYTMCSHDKYQIVKWMFYREIVQDYIMNYVNSKILFKFFHKNNMKLFGGMDCAIANQNLKLAKWLYRKGYSIQPHHLEIASQVGHLETVEWLISKGGMAVDKSNGEYSLTWAIANGNRHIVENLINTGVKLKVNDAVIRHAQVMGYQSTVRYLEKIKNTSK